MAQALVPRVIRGDRPAVLHIVKVNQGVRDIGLPQQPRRLRGDSGLPDSNGPSDQ